MSNKQLPEPEYKKVDLTYKVTYGIKPPTEFVWTKPAYEYTWDSPYPPTDPKCTITCKCEGGKTGLFASKCTTCNKFGNISLSIQRKLFNASL